MPRQTDQPRARKVNAMEELNERIADLAKRAKLDSWSAFVEELQVPAEIMPALATGRPELVRLATPRDYSAAEVKALLQIVGALLETNAALREHAQQVAHFVDNWGAAFLTLRSVGEKIRLFANFKHEQVGEESEDEGVA